MSIEQRKSVKGFTLIEMLLVLVIIAVLIFMGVGYMQQQSQKSRMDKTTLQLQTILNAALSYYVSNGSWPNSLGCLQGTDHSVSPCNIAYLSNPYNSPWGGGQYVAGQNGPLFYAYLSVSAGKSTAAVSNIIAGKLPLAYVSASAGSPPANDNSCALDSTQSTCYVVASVNIPGQSLNNASAVNFAGIYRHGGCVPVPSCPIDSTGTPMVPEIIVVPVSVSGFSGAGNLGAGTAQVYPISSFTAYATGGNNTAPPACNAASSAPPDCTTSNNGNNPASNAYWRACLQIITQTGDISTMDTTYGQAVGLGAFTRCSISNEPAGSQFTVYESES